MSKLGYVCSCAAAYIHTVTVIVKLQHGNKMSDFVRGRILSVTVK